MYLTVGIIRYRKMVSEVLRLRTVIAVRIEFLSIFMEVNN